MTVTTETVELPLTTRAADGLVAVPGQDNTYRAVYATGVRVKRMSSVHGPYYEQLSMDPAHIRTGRLDSGIVPILLDHVRSVDSQYGVVVRHWFEDGKGVVEFRMETGTAKSDGIRNKLDQRIIRAVSIGCRVHRYREIPGVQGEPPTMLAIDWEPFEVSLVATPEDAGAVIRSGDETHSCEIERAGVVPADPTPTTETPERSIIMTTPNTDTNLELERAAELETARTAAATEARTAERTRVSGISEVVRKAKLGADFAERLITDGTSLDLARAAVLDALAAQDDATATRTSAQVGHSYDAPDVVRAALVDAFAHKMDPSIKIDGKALEYRSFSMLEGFAAIEQANGRQVRFNREELAKRALMGTSDFPVILADAAHRVVLADYQAANPSFRSIARQRNFEDFRPHYVLRSGEFPALQPLSEHGEIKSASLSDANTEAVSLKTRAIKLGITRQLLVNDSLGVISDMIGKSGRRIAAQENQIAWAVLRDNPKLTDGKALFHTDHKNLHATPVATPDLAAFSAGRLALRKHTSDGIPLNFTARYVIVPTDLETDVERLLTSILATKEGDVNIWSGKLQIVSDAALDDHAAWYMATSPGDAEVLTYGYLGGASGPVVETKPGWDVDGAEMRVIADFGVGPTGEKGIYKFKRA